MRYSNDSKVPAYIRLGYDQRCSACGAIVKAGESAFYSKYGKATWHGKCGNEDWKQVGTPYYEKQQAAISYQEATKPKNFNLKDLIKLALRRFRKELVISPGEEPQIIPEVYRYLFSHNLIALDRGEYIITPKGFNWNVDAESVQLPAFEEDIMKRDEDIK